MELRRKISFGLSYAAPQRNEPVLEAANFTFLRGWAKIAIKLLNLQWLLQNRDRTDLKNPIEDLTFRVTCDHYNVEVRINLLGCFIHLITGSVRQLQVQKHEIEFLLPEAFNGLFSRTDQHSTEADLLQKCSKEILHAQIVVDH